MRALLPFAILALPAGCATAGHDEAGPAGIPYLCSGNLSVRAVYLDGGWTGRARVRLSYGGQTVELRSAPAAEGLLYQGTWDARDVVWQVSGEQARLHESNGGEENVFECVRVREAGAVPPAAEAPDHH